MKIKYLPKNIFLDKTYKEFRKDVDTKQEASLEADYQKVEEDALKAENFARLNNGEMWFCSGDEAFKAIAKAPSRMNLTYKKFDTNAIIPLKKLYPMERLVVELGGERQYALFPKGNIYNYSEYLEVEGEEYLKKMGA